MMSTMILSQDSPGYPLKLKEFLGTDAPKSIVALGNLEILKHQLLALFCSVRCPGNLILQTHDFVQSLRPDGVSVISGFHSPVERECLTILLRGSGPIVMCPAKSLDGMRIPSACQQPLHQGRLLFISPFEVGPRRPTAESADYRNRFVVALAEKVLVAYAEPSGKLEELSQEAIAWRKTVYTPDKKGDFPEITVIK